MTKQIEGLVARARELIGAKNDKLTEAQRQSNINEAWHLLGQIESTRSGVVDEAGMREILAEEYEKAGWPRIWCDRWIRLSDPDALPGLGAEETVAINAMRRVSKTDEVDKLDTAQDSIEAAVKKLCTQGTDCGWPLCGCDIQIFARDVMKAPAKTDEGRNDVSDEMVEVACDAFLTALNKQCGYHPENKIDRPDPRFMFAALEAANLCGRNAVIEQCAKIVQDKISHHLWAKDAKPLWNDIKAGLRALIPPPQTDSREG